MAVITVTRQYGSGGSKVAGLVAAQLGWTLIDNEFVEEVARSAGLPVATVVALEERAPSLKERLVSALATASPEVFVPTSAPTDEEKTEERIVRHTERVIAAAAQDGRVVLVGRGAQAVLAGATPELGLHVYVIAPREERIRTIMRRLSLNATEAARLTDETDANRDRYVERWYGRRRQDPANYHLVVNTGLMGYEGSAELVSMAARHKGWS